MSRRIRCSGRFFRRSRRLLRRFRPCRRFASCRGFCRSFNAGGRFASCRRFCRSFNASRRFCGPLNMCRRLCMLRRFAGALDAGRRFARSLDPGRRLPRMGRRFCRAFKPAGRFLLIGIRLAGAHCVRRFFLHRLFFIALRRRCHSGVRGRRWRGMVVLGRWIKINWMVNNLRAGWNIRRLRRPIGRLIDARCMIRRLIDSCRWRAALQIRRGRSVFPRTAALFFPTVASQAVQASITAGVNHIGSCGLFVSVRTGRGRVRSRTTCDVRPNFFRPGEHLAAGVVAAIVNVGAIHLGVVHNDQIDRPAAAVGVSPIITGAIILRLTMFIMQAAIIDIPRRPPPAALAIGVDQPIVVIAIVSAKAPGGCPPVIARRVAIGTRLRHVHCAIPAGIHIAGAVDNG